MRILVAGDSIAWGTGQVLHGATVNAKVGIPSGQIINRVAPGYDWVVISAGSNDPDNPSLRANLEAIRARVGDAKVIWILPINAKAHEAISRVSLAHRDETASFVPGPDRIHPKSYIALAAEIEDIMPEPKWVHPTWVQTTLNTLGADPQLTVDGVIGEQSKAAIEEFQSKHSLTVDGVVGAETGQALIDALAAMPKLKLMSMAPDDFQQAFNKLTEDLKIVTDMYAGLRTRRPLAAPPAAIDREKFFTAIRASEFHGSMNQSQVDGCNVIIDEWEKRGLTDRRWLAYILATAFWETARTMQPIREYGLGRGHPYGQLINGHAYYGRGLCQLTWIANYRKMGQLLGVDLVNNPDLALNPTIAAGVIFEGMIRGLFTGVGLGNYFNPAHSDWVNARRIINGTDRATTIAGIGKAFYLALETA